MVYNLLYNSSRKFRCKIARWRLTVVGTTHTTSGTYTQLLTSTGNTSLRFRGNEDFIGSISSVSVVEVQGDRPRLSYDITNGVVEDKPHLLLEPSSTNLATFSEDFSEITL